MTRFAPSIKVLPILSEVGYCVYWRHMAGDDEVDHPTAILEMQEWADLRRTSPLIIERIQQLSGSSDDPAESARLRLEAMYLIASRTQFLHPELQRPTWEFKLAIRLAALFTHLLQGEYDWLTDELGQEFTRARLRHFPAEIRSAMELWFGGESMGWMNHAEFVDAMAVLDAIIDGTETRDKIHQHWTNWSGDTSAFGPMWESFLVDMQAVRAEVAAIEPSQDVRIRYSLSYYAGELRRRGCEDTMDELAVAALREWQTLNGMANTLASGAGYEDWQDWVHNFRFGPDTIALLDSDAVLLEAYSDGSHEVFRIMREMGLLRVTWPDNYGWTVELINGADGTVTTTASCHPDRRSNDPNDPHYSTIKVGGWEHLPEPARTNHQRHQSQLWWITLWHEMMHVLQNLLQPGIVVNHWTWGAAANIAMEGSAFAAELLMLNSDPENVHLLLGVLQHRLLRLGRLVVENMYLNGTSFEEVVDRYMELSGLDRHSATVECQRMTINPLQFSSYVLGSWMLERAASEWFDGELTDCWTVYMEQTAGFIQPNFWGAVMEFTDSPNMSWIPDSYWLADYIEKTWLSVED